MIYNVTIHVTIDVAKGLDNNGELTNVSHDQDGRISFDTGEDNIVIEVDGRPIFIIDAGDLEAILRMRQVYNGE